MNIHAQTKSSILSRIPRDKPYSVQATQTAEAIFGVGNRLQALKSQLDGDPNLSDEGRRTKYSEAARELLKDYARASRPVRVALNHAKAQRAGLQPKAPDPTDAVSELKRQEKRAYLRSLALGQRISTAMQDTAMAEAAIADSPALSGLDERQLGELRDAYLKQKFAPQIAEIASVETTYTEVGNAVFLVRNALRDAIGLPPALFEALVVPIEQDADK